MAAEPAPRTVRVCICPRKSPNTGKRAKAKEEISLEYQDARMREYCATQPGWVVVAVRPETDHRYRLKARRVLMQIIEECKADLYDVVLFWDMTRMTADSDDIGWLAVEVRDAGARLRFVHNDPGEGRYAKVIRSLQADGSGEEVSLIRRRTGEGKHARMHEKGKPLARTAPYGMQWNHTADPHRFPLAEQRYLYLQPRTDDSADVVRRLFGWLADDGVSMGEAVRRLNADGVPAPQGGAWTRAGLAVVVRNPVYCGVEAVGRTRRRQAGRGASERWVRDARPREAWELLAVPHRPLVERAVWEAAQDAIAGRRVRTSRTPGALSARCLLRGGLATCARCGRPLWTGGQYTVLVQRPGTAPAGTTVVYYQCASTHSVVRDRIAAGQEAPCTEPANVRADLLDGAVWQAVLDASPPADDPARRETEAQAREAEAKRLERQRGRLARLLQEGERRLLVLSDPYRVAALEAVQASNAKELELVHARLAALASQGQAAAAERHRAVAVVEALTVHRERLLACRPWGDDPGQDEAMQGLVRALRVSAVVTRPQQARDRTTGRWTIRVGAVVDPEGVGDGSGVTGGDSTTRRGIYSRKYTPALQQALARFAAPAG